MFSYLCHYGPLKLHIPPALQYTDLLSASARQIVRKAFETSFHRAALKIFLFWLLISGSKMTAAFLISPFFNFVTGL